MLERPLTMASIPAAHPYVDALLDCEQVDRRVPSPADARDGTSLHAAVPPLAGLDALVVGFGVEQHPVSELRGFCHDVVRERCVIAPIVHDLDNPYLPAHLQRRHRRQLSMLVDVGSVVATLSEHARDALRARHDVDALLLPHPPLGPASPPARTSPGGRVLVHLESLRRNVMVDEALRALSQLARDGDVEVVVGIHEDVRLGNRLVGLLNEAQRRGARVERHQRLTSDELVRRLLATDVLLLPYSHGTHSGLLDLAVDLGTAVVAPGVGAYAEQGAMSSFRPRSRDVVRSMLDALDRALAADPPRPRDQAARHEEFATARRAWLGAVAEASSAIRPARDRWPTIALRAERAS